MKITQEEQALDSFINQRLAHADSVLKLLFIGSQVA